MKINVLSKSVYNRIAAGEVIDRPYSAVKELVENSLDSGADKIEIHIEQGGKQLIRVIDNGCGIERDDMRAAFLPHATSKIKCAEDLEKITTLGFRGEALASISVIARVELVSATEGNGAFKVYCEDGKVSSAEPAALEKGTDITVRDLFYNTPVRAKFLKTDKKEESDVTSFIIRYILGNPKVSFRYFVDGKLTLQSTGEGLDEAMVQVYGAKTVSQCIKINAKKDDISVHGFIGNQNFFKPNKTYQSLFLNGRYIVNNTIATAISNAYASYMMKRQYPFFVLNVDVPSDMVDVNVHPNKADVRFVDNRVVFSAVYSVISSVLDGTATAAEFVVDVIDKAYLPEIKSTAELNRQVKSEQVIESKTDKETGKTTNEASDQEQKAFYDPIVEEPLYNFLPKKDPVVMRVTNDSITNAFLGTSTDSRINDANERVKYEQQVIEYQSCKFKGNLFNTYLMYEIRDTVYIIDQHAAHERLIYDRLCEKIANRSVDKQGFLSSYLLDTNPQESRFIEDNLKVIRSMGFDIQPFGTCAFKIDAVPTDLQDINLKEFFDEILSNLNGLKDIRLEEVLKDKIAMTACKHAIKGGQQLTEDEVTALFRMLEGNMGLKCPHGRPVCFALTKRDIEKMFKRIV
ncbi:MAG: DNA mismatch repair endonuclease MutL [Clostridia bacterium]|nr:DNA mismatch repair endonuclease MutL [Clostridia bacterium]